MAKVGNEKRLTFIIKDSFGMKKEEGAGKGRPGGLHSLSGFILPTVLC